MAYGRLKTNMRGDTSRWGHRADVKHEADRLRRVEDREACEALEWIWPQHSSTPEDWFEEVEWELEEDRYWYERDGVYDYLRDHPTEPLRAPLLKVNGPRCPEPEPLEGP